MESMEKTIQIFICFNRMKKGMGKDKRSNRRDTLKIEKEKSKREARTRLLRLESTDTKFSSSTSKSNGHT